MGHFSFLLGLGACMILFCPLRLESVFPPVLWKSCSQVPLAFKVIFPRDSQSLYWIPRLGRLTQGLEPLQQWENFLVLLFSSLWITHSAGMGFDLNMFVPLLPSWCGFFFVFGHGISFFWWVPVSSCWWLFKRWLQFWCSYRRRWAHILLLYHLEPELMSLLFDTLSRVVIAFLQRSKHLLISWLQSMSTVIFEPKKIKSVTVSTFSSSICHESDGTVCHDLRFLNAGFQASFFTLSPSLRSSLVPLHFLPLEWYDLHIWGYWYFLRQSWF